MAESYAIPSRMSVIGGISIVAGDEDRKIDSGEAKGFDRGGKIVSQGQVGECHEHLFPYEASDGVDFLRVTPGIFGSFQEKVLDRCKVDITRLKDADIMQKLEKILVGADEKWRVRQITFTSPVLAQVCFGSTTKADWNLEDNVLLLDFSETSDVMFQIAKSVSSGRRPYRKILYKVKENETSEREVILACWTAGAGTVLHRVQPETGLCTVEEYPDGVDLLIDNL